MRSQDRALHYSASRGKNSVLSPAGQHTPRILTTEHTEPMKSHAAYAWRILAFLTRPINAHVVRCCCMRHMHSGASTPFRHWGVDPLSFLPFPLSLPSSPLIQLGGLGERCKLPQRVRAEPGHQTHFGAFFGKNKAFQGADVLYCLTDRTVRYLYKG